MPSNHLILCSLLLLPSIFPSIRVFSNESVLCIRWPSYWSFSISPFKEYSGVVSYRMDWLDLFAVQGVLKSLLQHHSSKALILQCSAFFFFFLILFDFNWRLITLQLWWFLPYTDMNQPWVYMCPPIHKSLCIPSLCVVPVHWLRVPCFMHWTWSGHQFHVW